MSLELKGIQSSVLAATEYMIDTTFKVISFAGEGISAGASWGSRQVVALGPVLQEGGEILLDKTAQLASLIYDLSLKALAVMIPIVESAARLAVQGTQEGLRLTAQFVQTYPSELGSAACAVVVVLALQHFMKEETASA
jgi:hypothetical protein